MKEFIPMQFKNRFIALSIGKIGNVLKNIGINSDRFNSESVIVVNFQTVWDSTAVNIGLMCAKKIRLFCSAKPRYMSAVRLTTFPPPRMTN